jgi:hypothetical protein
VAWFTLVGDGDMSGERVGCFVISTIGVSSRFVIPVSEHDEQVKRVRTTSVFGNSFPKDNVPELKGCCIIFLSMALCEFMEQLVHSKVTY